MIKNFILSINYSNFVFKSDYMKFFLKNSGILLVLTGAFFLIVPFFAHLQTNLSLLIGWLLIIVGFIVYIVINKLIK